MKTDGSQISPETRWVFRIYAVLAAVSGLILSGWGMIWLGSHLPGLPFYKAALIRVAGGVLLAAACFAFALDGVEDPEARRRACLWFGIGHAVLFLVLLSQQAAIWESPLVERILTVVLVAAFAFFYLWSGDYTNTEARATLISIFGRSDSPHSDLRKAYQRQIREAALQEERHRLARDLHDSVKQQIFAIGASAATAQARFDNDPAGARAAIDQVRASAREAMTEMEAMLDQLRAAPLENAGLVASLRQQCEALGFRTGAKVEFELGGLPDNLRLAPGAQEALFRVAQEALANVARHARAVHVWVRLAVERDFLKLTVKDDGAGFAADEPAHGMGLSNMRARAAEFNSIFEITSSPGEGTTVSLCVPTAAVFPIAEYNRRLLWYGAMIAANLAVAVWRQSSAFTWVTVLFCIYFARTVSARSAARRAIGVVK